MPTVATQAVMLLAVQQHFVRAAPMSGTKLYSFVPPSLIAPCSQLYFGDVLAHNYNRTNPSLCAQSHHQLNIVRLVPFTHPSLLHFSIGQSIRCLLQLCSPSGHRLRSGTALAQIFRLCSMPHYVPPLCAHRSREGLLYWSPRALALAGRFRSFVPHSLPRPFAGSQNQI
jgi:hypothetical protein